MQLTLRGRPQPVSTVEQVDQTAAMRVQPSVRGYADLAAAILAAPPRLGPVRLVAVDGCAGNGKTTFADRLATILRCPVVHTDDLLDGWTIPAGYWPRLENWVLAPLRSGRPGRYRRYDWVLAEFAEWHDVPVTPVLVIEGVTSARAEVRPELTLSVWIEAPADIRFARGIARDGEALRPQWIRWMAEESLYVRVDGAPEKVDVVVDGNPSLEHDPATQFVQLD